MNADYSRPRTLLQTVFEVAGCARGLSGPNPASTLFHAVDDLWNASQRALKKRSAERKGDAGPAFTRFLPNSTQLFSLHRERLISPGGPTKQDGDVLSRPLKHRAANEHLHDGRR